MKIFNLPLNESKFFKESVNKKQVIIHVRKECDILDVETHYVISNNKIYKRYDDMYWNIHIKSNYKNNIDINKKSISITVFDNCHENMNALNILLEELSKTYNINNRINHINLETSVQGIIGVSGIYYKEHYVM